MKILILSLLIGLTWSKSIHQKKGDDNEEDLELAYSICLYAWQDGDACDEFVGLYEYVDGEMGDDYSADEQALCMEKWMVAEYCYAFSDLYWTVEMYTWVEDDAAYDTCIWVTTTYDGEADESGCRDFEALYNAVSSWDQDAYEQCLGFWHDCEACVYFTTLYGDVGENDEPYDVCLGAWYDSEGCGHFEYLYFMIAEDDFPYDECMECDSWHDHEDCINFKALYYTVDEGDDPLEICQKSEWPEEHCQDFADLYEEVSGNKRENAVKRTKGHTKKRSFNITVKAGKSIFKGKKRTLEDKMKGIKANKLAGLKDLSKKMASKKNADQNDKLLKILARKLMKLLDD